MAPGYLVQYRYSFKQGEGIYDFPLINVENLLYTLYIYLFTVIYIAHFP